MNANPAPTHERITIADRLVHEAHDKGAQLVVLPEVFNTGYGYTDANYERTETLEGPTVTWMKEIARKLDIHLAGSLFLLDEDEIYNALLLFAPDGRMWRYDKLYPAGFERAYFREGKDTAIAHTDLGDIGFLICWDIAHPRLWARYAGQVDLMVIACCPVDISDPTYRFPDGEELTHDDMGLLLRSTKGTVKRFVGPMVEEQTTWLGVPAVSTVACGEITTPVPGARTSFLSAVIFAPRLIKHFRHADEVRMTCKFAPSCKIISADGHILDERAQEDGESFAFARVTLSDRKPSPERRDQPASKIPLTSYLFTDFMLPLMMVPRYRRGSRASFGNHMAPPERNSKRLHRLLRSLTRR
jgi:predicted amidohydrolase